jgi:hypothetical protein
MSDNDERRDAKKSENPGGVGFPQDPEQLNRSYGRNVDPDEAERAADRALADQPVTAEEIRDQSAYDDLTSDVAQRAGESEREREDGEPDSGDAPPRAFPDAKP